MRFDDTCQQLKTTQHLVDVMIGQNKIYEIHP